MLPWRVEQLKAHKANCTLFLLVASPRLRFHCTFVFETTQSVLPLIGRKKGLFVREDSGRVGGEFGNKEINWENVRGLNGNLGAGLDLLL